MKEATVIMATCQKGNNTFGIRAEKINNKWHFTWAFPISKKMAGREGYDSTTINGSIMIDSEYPGCPYCTGKGFVHCGRCHKVVCWDNKSTKFLCPVCGNQGDIKVTDEFDNIKAGGY